MHSTQQRHTMTPQTSRQRKKSLTAHLVRCRSSEISGGMITFFHFPSFFIPRLLPAHRLLAQRENKSWWGTSIAGRAVLVLHLDDLK